MASKDDRAAARQASTRDEIEVDDLVIFARDREFYRFKSDEFKDEQKLPTSMTYQVELLVEQGVVLADIPLGSIPGVGCMCFLLNLSGLHRPGTEETRRALSGARTGAPSEAPADDCLLHPAPAIDDLVVRDRMENKFYWIKRCEYQTADHKLEPALASKLEKLTAQGVMLADVPARRLTGVDADFCLVNLSAILRPEIKMKEEEEQRRKEAAARGVRR